MDMNLETLRNKLFDEDFKLKSGSDNLTELLYFCAELKNITGIQVCTYNGLLYEYLPQVYNSVVKRK